MNKKRSVELSAKRAFNVALVEGQPELLKYWVKLINRLPDFVCSCACATGEEALLAVPQVNPDVVLMDIFMPGISGIECTRQLKKLSPQVPIIMFTSADNQEMVIRALEAGADGYLLKPTKPADLHTALFGVLQDGAPLTSQISRYVVESFRLRRPLANEPNRLSLKEEWILMLLCQGYTNGRIADKLNLSIHTICRYLKGVFKKFGVTSRTQAAACYLASKTPQLKPEDLVVFTYQINSVVNFQPAGRFSYPAGSNDKTYDRLPSSVSHLPPSPLMR